MPVSRNRRGPLAITVTGVLTAALTMVGVAAASPAAAQPFTPGDYYQLVAVHSGKAIDIANASTEPGAMAQQWEPQSGQHQQFRFEPSGGDQYRVIARHSGHALDVFEWNPDPGAEIRQWTDLDGTNQQFSIIDHGGGQISLINNFSGLALDVWEFSQADGGRISQWDYTGNDNQRFQLVPVGGGGGPGPGPSDGPIGWASMNGGTTGGEGGSTVTVSNASQFLNAVQNNNPTTVLVQGDIALSDMENIGSNKTIIGVGSNATIRNGGLRLSGVENIIVRNINFIDNTIGEGDALDIQESTRNVWVDHNYFTGQADGSVDIKRESDFITVSWNHFDNTDKTMLLGHSDGHTDDIGHLRITYHHNWFDNSESRHPRVRFGNPVHVFNNYYLNNSGYGVASTQDAGVLVEGNYFQNVGNPTHVGFASSGPGDLVFQNNVLDNSGNPEQTGGGVNPIPYSYTVDNPNNIPSIVTSGVGTGQVTP